MKLIKWVCHSGCYIFLVLVCVNMLTVPYASFLSNFGTPSAFVKWTSSYTGDRLGVL